MFLGKPQAFPRIYVSLPWRATHLILSYGGVVKFGYPSKSSRVFYFPWKNHPFLGYSQPSPNRSKVTKVPCAAMTLRRRPALLSSCCRSWEKSAARGLSNGSTMGGEKNLSPSNCGDIPTTLMVYQWYIHGISIYIHGISIYLWYLPWIIGIESIESYRIHRYPEQPKPLNSCWKTSMKINGCITRYVHRDRNVATVYNKTIIVDNGELTLNTII